MVVFETQVVALILQRFVAKQAVGSDDIGMAIIMNNHVHFGGTADLFIDFDAVKFFFGKIVPVAEVISAAFAVVFVGFSAHFV